MDDELAISGGPLNMKATGNTVVNVLLSVLIIMASAFVVYSENQQTILITQQHAEHQAQLAQNALLMANWARANENVFLSTMLPDSRKKELPAYIQDRAREIVEQRAERITEGRVR